MVAAALKAGSDLKHYAHMLSPRPSVKACSSTLAGPSVKAKALGGNIGANVESELVCSSNWHIRRHHKEWPETEQEQLLLFRVA